MVETEVYQEMVPVEVELDRGAAVLEMEGRNQFTFQVGLAPCWVAPHCAKQRLTVHVSALGQQRRERREYLQLWKLTSPVPCV